MTIKFLFTAICIQIAVSCFAQTEDQKQLMYEYINNDSKGSGRLIPKIAPIENKEALFKVALVYPVKHVELDLHKNPSLSQGSNDFLVMYGDRVYVFFKDRKSRLFENSPVIRNMAQLLKDDSKFSIVYFTDNFSFDGTYLNPIITDSQFSYLIAEKGEKYTNILDYINFKYGSFEKYEDRVFIDKLRRKLTTSDVKQSIANNYSMFEKNCPKDTALVIKTFINQIKQAVPDLTNEQETHLISNVKTRINPYDNIYSGMADSKGDSLVKKIIKENLQKSEAGERVIRADQVYQFQIYGVNITNELLLVLSNRQFSAYKTFIDVRFPIIESNNERNSNKYRYEYGKEVLGDIGNVYDYKKYKDYSDKIITDCGCPVKSKFESKNFNK